MGLSGGTSIALIIIMKTKTDRDLISEEEFNRIIINRHSAKPEDDSKDDSGVNRALESEIGDHFIDGDFDALDEIEGDNGLDESDDADDEKIEEDISSANHSGSSTWPDKSEISED